jgi:hypothetical protein
MKIIVDEKPIYPSDCPFSVFDCEYGYRCSLNRDTYLCGLDKNYDCNMLVEFSEYMKGR